MSKALETEQIQLEDGSTFEITHGSGNVFADMGLPDADELFYKAQLAHEIRVIIAGRGLSQREAAKLVGVRQPDLSKLMNGNTERFTSDRLFSILTRLGHRVEVRVSRRAVKAGQARIVVA